MPREDHFSVYREATAGLAREEISEQSLGGEDEWTLQYLRKSRNKDDRCEVALWLD